MYNVKIKLTIDQFRYFKYDDNGGYIDELFGKSLYDGSKKCTDANEWLTDTRWQEQWLKKNVLRDNGEISIIDEIKLKINGKAELIHIWQDGERIEQSGDTAVVHDLQKGVFVRVNRGDN